MFWWAEKKEKVKTLSSLESNFQVCGNGKSLSTVLLSKGPVSMVMRTECAFSLSFHSLLLQTKQNLLSKKSVKAAQCEILHSLLDLEILLRT